MKTIELRIKKLKEDIKEVCLSHNLLLIELMALKYLKYVQELDLESGEKYENKFL